ncbi:hypothetical protein FRC11_014291 [Ceratobasidium sp. 423]|nr:hypothetical protein FRC11_014291 [Ceratobasidium sp. 423]
MSVPPHGSSQHLPPASGNPSVLLGFPASQHPSEALRRAQSTAPSASRLAPPPPSGSQAPCRRENSMVPPPLPYQHGYQGSSVAPPPPFPRQNGSRRPSVPPPPPLPPPSQPSNQHPGRGQFNEGRRVDRGPNQGRGPQPGSTSGAQRHNGMTDRSRTVSTATTASGQSGRQQLQQGAVGNPGPEDGNAQQVRQGEDVMPDGQGDQGNADDEGAGGAVHQVTGGRSHLRKYKGVKRSVLRWAGHTYTAIMATQGMYETDLGTLGKRQLEAWKIGCAKYEVDPKMLPIGVGHIKNMNDRLVTWHGKSRDSVRQYVEAAFFSDDWSANMIKARIKELKASGLHMKPGARQGTGYFQHDILQTCLEKIFFKTYWQKNKKDIAMDFPELFMLSFFPSAGLTTPTPGPIMRELWPTKLNTRTSTATTTRTAMNTMGTLNLAEVMTTAKL